MKLLIVALTLLASASAQAGYAIELFGENWILEGNRTEPTSDWMPHVSFKDITLYPTDSQGEATGGGYLLRVNSNGWGDRALDVVCTSVTGGQYPYAQASLISASGFFLKKDAIKIIGDGDQQGKATHYEFERIEPTDSVIDYLHCYAKKEHSID